jgi:hypothetical protein
MTEEEEKEIAHLERLVANIDFDDLALHMLGFHMDIYYMSGHLGWVQSSNGVSVNTHKEFTLEILMTMAHILDEGVPSFSFHLKELNKWFPMILGNCLVLKREPRNKCMCMKAHWKDFGV